MIKISKWVINSENGSEDIENKLSEFNERFVFVDKKYSKLLKELNIPTYIFSDKGKECYFVRRGKKPKRFSEDDVKEILNDLKDKSIRKVALKYNCSTRTIQAIKRNEY